MKRSLFLLLLLFAVATAFAQTYDAVMPGQKKVTTVDSTGNATTQIVTDYNSEYIQYRSGGSWFYKGQTMSKDEFVSKMKSECTPAYEQFQRGVRQKRAGIAMAATGGAIFIAGLSVWAWGASFADEDFAGRFIWNTPMYAGFGVWMAGLALGFGGGATCIIMGSHKQAEAHQVYNYQCARKEQANNYELRLQTSSNGIGLAFAW